jgi:16S rRNA (guanine966-N2)-methyltransferase
MRVIAGEFRSRQLVAPRGHATRPTSDRLRETLFNVLAPRIADGVFADLFAGSGAVGIEALSRGAPHVVFVENSPPALSALRENLRALGLHPPPSFSQSSGPARYAIDPRTVAAFLRACPYPLSTVFLDPPYEDTAAYASTLTTLGAALPNSGSEFAACLTPSSLVVAEHAAPSTRKRLPPLADAYGNLRRTRLLTQGDAALSFYSLSQ